MGINKVCCVTGHRDIPENKIAVVKAKLEQEIKQAIADGFSIFISGFACRTDLIFAEIVDQYKGEHPHLFLEAAIPYANRLNSRDPLFQQLIAKCNGIKPVSDKYHPQCFEQRNRYMVQQSSRVIAVYDGRERGGTLFTMRYAHCLEKEVRVINIEK